MNQVKPRFWSAWQRRTILNSDGKFVFNQTLDYPRKEKKAIDRSGEDPKAIICIYELSDEIIHAIEEVVGKGSWIGTKEIEITSLYSGAKQIGGCELILINLLLI